MVRLPITNSWCIHRAVLISLVQPFLKLLPPPRGPSHSSGRVWRRKLATFKRETATFPHSQLSLPASLWWLPFPLCLWFHFGRLYIISEFMQCLSFCSCLTSVSTMSSRSTCVVTSDVILPHTRLNSVLLHLYHFFLSFLLFYFWDCVLLCCPSCAEPNRWKLPFHFCLLSGWDSRYGTSMLSLLHIFFIHSSTNERWPLCLLALWPCGSWSFCALPVYDQKVENLTEVEVSRPVGQ